MKLDDVVEKHAVANALKYKGKANPKALIGGVIADYPDAKKDMKKTQEVIKKITENINSLGLTKIQELAKKKYPEILEKKEKSHKKELKELNNVGKKVVMRFAPSPSGPMHIGHALTGGLTSLYIDKYKGDFILRIEDTNPENIYPPAYELLEADSDWIFGNVSSIWIQSDRLDYYYEYAERFIKQGDAYVCECTQEKFKELVDKSEPCPCRDCSAEDHVVRWKKMFDKDKGYKQGDVVLRFKSDIKHKNPAMRDFPLARINDSEHPRKEFAYRVWPLMNLSVFVDDVEGEMTHIIRAKEHADNAKRQALMYKAIKKQPPETYFVGRINFEGLELSATKTKEKIEKGEYDGWEDIRLPFLGALRRRGYQAEAFKSYSKEIGISQNDKTVHKDEFFKTLNSFNKDIIDATSSRYFFIEKPVKIEVKGAPTRKLLLKFHPDHQESKREFEVSNSYFIEEEDFNKIKDGSLVRLMDNLNFIKKGKEFIFDSLEYEKFKDNGKQIIHWIPVGTEHNVQILMPDKTLKKGMAEQNVLEIAQDTVIQFERFGFCRLDKRDEDCLEFWFGHK